MTTQPRTISTPNCFRSGRNESGSSITANLVLKAGVTYDDQVALASDPADILVGVSVETIENTYTRSIQTSGKAAVYSGAAITRGDYLTVDSAGKVVTASPTAATVQSLVGRAVTTAGGANVLVEVELMIGIVYVATGLVTLTGTQTLTNKRIVEKTGADITGDIALTVASGCLFEVIPAGNLTVTLPVTASDGDHMIFSKPGTEAFTADIGGLYTIPSGSAGRVEVEYLHGAWRVAAGPRTGAVVGTHTHANADQGGQMTDAALSAAVGAAKGGTGQTVYTIGDLVFASGVAALSKLGIGTNGQVLRTNAGATAPEWATYNYASMGTGILPVANGGTGIATVASGAVLYASAIDTVAALAIGAAYKGLRVNSAGTFPEYGPRMIGGSAEITFVGGAETIEVTEGQFRFIDTTDQNSTLGVGVANAVAGDRIDIVYAGGAAHTIAVNNGGAGAGTLMTMSASKKAGCSIGFDGANWRLISSYQQP